MRTAVVIGLTFALAAPGITGEGRMSFRDLPPSAWNKRVGDFQIALSVSMKAREYVAAWNERSRTEPLEVHETTVIPREVEFGVILHFTNCPVSDKGTCDVRVVFQILSSTGELIIERDDLEFWPWPPPKKDSVQLARSTWITSAEATDPPGEYRIRALVMDSHTGSRIVLERVIRHT